MSTRLLCTWRLTFCNQLRYSNQIRLLHSSSVRYGPIEERISRKLSDKLQSEDCRRLTTLNKTTLTSKRKVAVIGGGSWGTAVADLVSYNVIKFPQYFDSEVLLYLRDLPLCETIERERENVKYLPTIRLQANLKPLTSLEEALFRTDIIIFAVPHEFVTEICCKINDLKGLEKEPIGVSLVKGLHFDENGNLERISQVIERMVGIKVGVLSGANVAIEVAKRQYCEATLCPPTTEDRHLVTVLMSLFSAPYFKVTLSDDQSTVELCAALKNIIACGAGLIDGLGFGINTKAAAIACGFRELVTFVRLYNPQYCPETLFSSCGIADTIASSFGGRNRKVGEAFVRDSSDLEVLEKKLLKGQKLQGPNTAKSVYRLLEGQQRLEKFPFFTAVHRIFHKGDDPKTLLEAIRMHY